MLPPVVSDRVADRLCSVWNPVPLADDERIDSAREAILPKRNAIIAEVAEPPEPEHQSHEAQNTRRNKRTNKAHASITTAGRDQRQALTMRP
jgi:hypothetical protein